MPPCHPGSTRIHDSFIATNQKAPVNQRAAVLLVVRAIQVPAAAAVSQLNLNSPCVPKWLGMKALFDFCRADAAAACLMLMSSHQNDKDEPFRGKKNMASRGTTRAGGCGGETAVNDGRFVLDG